MKQKNQFGLALSCRWHYLINIPHVDELIVCPNGQQFLVCSSNHLFLEWMITTTNQSSLHQTRTVSSSALSSVVIIPIE